MSEEEEPRYVTVYRLIRNGTIVASTTRKASIPFLLERHPGATIREDQVRVA